MEIVKQGFKTSKNETGALTFIEGSKDVPFDISRVYYIYDLASGVHRGFHAHRTLQQYLICVHGSCMILLDDGEKKETVQLDDPSKGLYVPPEFWHEMYQFSEGAVLLVLASQHYNEKDYIRDYDEFLKFIQRKDNH